MRFSKLILGVLSVGAWVSVAAAGCGSSNTGTGNSATTSGTATGTGTGGSAGCALKASCTAADHACVGLVSNMGKSTFGLRMTDLEITAPPALASGLVAGLVGSAVELSLPACNQSGTGSFSWLLQFNTTAGTLTTGGAKPPASPTDGYSFDMETISGTAIAPVTIQNVMPSSTGAFTTGAGQDINVPIFISTASVVLPIKAAVLTGTLSSNNDCIGSYNAAGLQTSNSCSPSTTPPIPGFLTGGTLAGYITLADADGIQISTLGGSLCALLAGGIPVNQYTTTTAAGIVCAKGDGGGYLFQGDWCSTTNAAGGCADAMQLTANYAAGSVTIN
jgi:hypothetical protein